MFEGLGTAWSRDPALVASLPTNEGAAANWLELRALLSELGFGQTTLTNFERNEFRGRDRRFVYEEFSYRPDRYDMLGFGPSGISFAGWGHVGVKAMNPETASDYMAAIDRGRPSWERAYRYDRRDLGVFHVIRRLAALRIDRRDYRKVFGSDPLDEFAAEFEALEGEGLVAVTHGAIAPTAVGMCYADSIAALLSRRIREAGRSARAHENAYGHM
jgi:oxygen-independent coproporphyrinogen-3 oxidase